MSMTHPNAETLRQIYADLSRIGDFAAQNIVLHRAEREIGDHPLCGIDAVQAHEAGLLDATGGSLVMYVEQVVANDHFGVVLATLRATRPRDIAMPVCGLWRFENGRITEHWENAHDVATLTRLLAPAAVPEHDVIAELVSELTPTFAGSLIGPDHDGYVIPFAHGLQQALDHEFADGHRNYTKEIHLTGLPDNAIDTILGFWKDMPMDGELAIINLGNGAMQDVAEDGSSFANRQSPWWLHFSTYWDDPADDADFMSRIRSTAHDLVPWTGEGVYIKVLNLDELDRVVEAFGGAEKYRRLGGIKASYDPQNLFRINHNIRPENAPDPNPT